MNTSSVINRGSYTQIPLMTLPGEQLALDIANGKVPYQITPCPVTGGHHQPMDIYTDAGDYFWVAIECGACRWNAMGGIIGKTETELKRIDETDPDYFDDVPPGDVTLVPDDEFNRDPNTGEYYASGTIYCWREYVLGGGIIGMDVTDFIYHTHDRMPVPDPKDPGQVIWPIV